MMLCDQGLQGMLAELSQALFAETENTKGSDKR
jgi:hypothetical protein